MSPAPQHTNNISSVSFDTSIQTGPTGTLAKEDLAGLPVTATAASKSESSSSPSSTSDAKTASLLDAHTHGSGKNVGIAIGIAIAIVVLVVVTTILAFCLRRRKQAKQAQDAEARLKRPSQIEDVPPPHVPSKGRFYHTSLNKGDLPPTPTRPQGIVINERAPTRPSLPMRSVTLKLPLPLRVAQPPVRSNTQPSMPMTHMTEGSWATLPTMSTQSTLPKAYVPEPFEPLPSLNLTSRFST